MAEPPSGWTAPDDQDPDAGRQIPGFHPVPGAQASPGSPSEAAPPGPDQFSPAQPTPGQPGPGRPTPGWGAPPEPGPPSNWDNQPGPWGAQPPPWGAQPTPWGPQPPQWPAPPGPGQPGAGQPGLGQPPGNWIPGGWSNGPGAGPGIVPLRPLVVGEIFDGAVKAIRGNPRTMVGFSAIVIAILTLLVTGPQALVLSVYQNSPLADPNRSENIHRSDLTDLIGASTLSVLIGILEFVLATTIISALLIVAVDSAVRGRPLNPGQLWARVRPRLPAVFGLAVLVPLITTLGVCLAVLPGVIVLFLPGGTVTTTIGVVLLVFGVLLGVLGAVALYLGFWAVGAPALLLENLGVFAALGRSYRLVRGSFWRVLGIGLLTGLVSDILRSIVIAPFSLFGTWIGSTQDSTGFGSALIRLLITDIGTILAGAVLYPFAAGVVALLYLDLRMRKEGLDVDLMRR